MLLLKTFDFHIIFEFKQIIPNIIAGLGIVISIFNLFINEVIQILLIQLEVCITYK